MCMFTLGIHFYACFVVWPSGTLPGSLSFLPWVDILEGGFEAVY